MFEYIIGCWYACFQWTRNESFSRINCYRYQQRFFQKVVSTCVLNLLIIANIEIFVQLESDRKIKNLNLENGRLFLVENILRWKIKSPFQLEKKSLFGLRKVLEPMIQKYFSCRISVKNQQTQNLQSEKSGIDSIKQHSNAYSRFLIILVL